MSEDSRAAHSWTLFPSSPSPFPFIVLSPEPAGRQGLMLVSALSSQWAGLPSEHLIWLSPAFTTGHSGRWPESSGDFRAAIVSPFSEGPCAL